MTDYLKKILFLMLYLFAQKEFQKKLSMWEYLQVESYRFRYVLWISVTSNISCEGTQVEDFEISDPKIN